MVRARRRERPCSKRARRLLDTRPAEASPKCSDRPALPRNGLVQIVIVTVREHLIQHPEHASSAAVESNVRESQVSFTVTDALRNGGALVDQPQTPQRECGHFPSL